MHKGNAKEFKAHGNAHRGTAGIKVDLTYDLLSGMCISRTLERATDQDKSLDQENIT